MAGTAAVIDIKQALADCVRTEVADTVSSLAEGRSGCGIDDPRMGKDFVYCNP